LTSASRRRGSFSALRRTTSSAYPTARSSASDSAPYVPPLRTPPRPEASVVGEIGRGGKNNAVRKPRWVDDLRDDVQEWWEETLLRQSARRRLEAEGEPSEAEVFYEMERLRSTRRFDTRVFKRLPGRSRPVLDANREATANAALPCPPNYHWDKYKGGCVPD
jgi:hypothetical protein